MGLIPAKKRAVELRTVTLKGGAELGTVSKQ